VLEISAWNIQKKTFIVKDEDLQVTKGVPHTHRRRQRTDRHRVLLATIPVANHHAVTTPLSSLWLMPTVSGIGIAAAVFAFIAFAIAVTGCLWRVVVVVLPVIGVLLSSSMLLSHCGDWRLR
jgi:hypothetical protein